MIHRIAITGPESTGKSSLAKDLAHAYQTVWVPEFARIYLPSLGRPYDQEDILTIARAQYEHENRAEGEARQFLFCDTDFLVTRIWSLHSYGSCPEWIDRMFKAKTYALHLLCAVDLPWEPDPLREHPHDRQFFFDWYLQELKALKVPVEIVSGNGLERLQNAIKIMERYFNIRE